MTRFARAKGSKSSNIRTPEEATSWQEMKRQMEERKCQTKVQKLEVERMAQEERIVNSADNDKKATLWADFQDIPHKKRKIKSEGNPKPKKVKAENNAQQNRIINIEINKKYKRKNKSDEHIIKSECTALKEVNTANSDSDDDMPQEVSAKVRPVQIVVKQKKQKTEHIKININANNNNINFPEPLSGTDHLKEKKKQRQKLRRLKAAEKLRKPKEELTEEDLKKIEKKREKHKRQLEKRKKAKAEKKLAEKEVLNNTDTNLNNTKNLENNRNINVKRMLPKVRDDKEHQRRKPYIETTTIEINGKNVDLMYFGGFLIKKEDAKRLYNLRNELRKKGIPKSEIENTLKLERRKAEKALSREKKKLCFNCRKSGHELSECPNLNDQSAGTGICFKCGSTEHTHFECKVVRNQDYKFAVCFICKEEGHISKQCPDNPKGIYPKGGSCKLCQDVTHLKKDCPLFQQQQESANITADTMKSNCIETLDYYDSNKEKVANVQTKKIVKFKS